MGKADLHIHTTCSDGILTPEKVVAYHVFMNANSKIGKFRDVIAITDHDTLNGALRAIEFAEKFRKSKDLIAAMKGKTTRARGRVFHPFEISKLLRDYAEMYRERQKRGQSYGPIEKYANRHLYRALNVYATAYLRVRQVI